jgi:hypothetical protein
VENRTEPAFYIWRHLNRAARLLQMKQGSADPSGPTDQRIVLAEQQPVLADEIKVGTLKRPAHRPKENEAFATEVAYAYWRLRVESGLSAKQAEWRICEQYKICRAYMFDLMQQVTDRREY